MRLTAFISLWHLQLAISRLGCGSMPEQPLDLSRSSRPWLCSLAVQHPKPWQCRVHSLDGTACSSAQAACSCLRSLRGHQHQAVQQLLQLYLSATCTLEGLSCLHQRR